MVPISNLLKYAFRQEGLTEDRHKHLLQLLQLHNDKPYCESMKRRGMLSDCEAVKHTHVKIDKHRTAGHPIAADAGESKMCEDHGVFTELCAAGAGPTCNGAYMAGRCERFDIQHQHGHWRRVHRFGQYSECRTGAISGVCTSGSGMDCNDGKDGSAIFCNTSMKVNKKRGHCQYKVQKKNSGVARCKAG